MVELINDTLAFSFPDVHPDAKLSIQFQRTLRLPDSDRTYPLPPGLGAFPVRHVDDFAGSVPPAWQQHGGVMLPMYQSEALWIWFNGTVVRDRHIEYPMAVKIAAGKINAVTGQGWTNGLHADPQDYVVTPSQPWLDGFAVEKDVVRQFVAMPLGSGYTAEEQLTGTAEHGGLQILVRPMRREEFERRFPPQRRVVARLQDFDAFGDTLECSIGSMGLAPGGRMKQAIHRDRYGLEAWDQRVQSRCFVHLANSLVWEAITGAKPPSPPQTAAHYQKHGLPWFDYYAERETSLDGGEALRRLKSVIQIARQKRDVPHPENQDVPADPVITLTPRTRHEVRDGLF